MDLKKLKSLRYNGRYVTSRSAETFEFFGFAWDIESMLKRTKELSLEPTEVDLVSLKQWLGLLGVNKEYAMQSENKDPIVMVELTPGELMIVDGCHRVYRDLQNGIETGLAFIVPFEEQIKFLYRKDMFARAIQMAKKKLQESDGV